MGLSQEDREYVIGTAVELLRHRKRRRLLEILADRLTHGDYPDDAERDLDEIAHAIASAVDDQLGE